MSEIEWHERGLPCEVFDPLNRKLSRPAFVELSDVPDDSDVDPEGEAW